MVVDHLDPVHVAPVVLHPLGRQHLAAGVALHPAHGVGQAAADARLDHGRTLEAGLQPSRGPVEQLAHTELAVAGATRRARSQQVRVQEARHRGRLGHRGFHERIHIRHICDITLHEMGEELDVPGRPAQRRGDEPAR